jgi:hypothetical protein
MTRVDTLRRTVRSSRAWARAAVPDGLPGAPGALPEFVIIGAQRSGTTSLYRHLADHPDVRVATGKELQFLSLHHGRGVRWYRAHFPVRPPSVRSFEASPYYLFHPDAPGRAAAVLPQARFVAVLRDPVERAYSHYLHSRRQGVEPLSFADALLAEPERLAAGRIREYSYVARGRYAEQLARWRRHVPAARLLVVRTEEVADDPARVTRFLGLDPHPAAALPKHTRRVDDGPTELTPELRERLTAEFAPANAALADMLGWAEIPWPVRHPS